MVDENTELNNPKQPPSDEHDDAIELLQEDFTSETVLKQSSEAIAKVELVDDPDSESYTPTETATIAQVELVDEVDNRETSEPQPTSPIDKKEPQLPESLFLDREEPPSKPKITVFPKDNARRSQSPFSIPGAPEPITFESIYREFVRIMQIGFEALQQNFTNYRQEVTQATWWRFWVLVGGVTLLTQVITLLGLVVLLRGVGLPVLIISFLLGVPVTLGILYGSIFVSHWFATTQREGKSKLVNHAYAIAIPYMPAQLFSAVIALIFIGLGGGLVGSTISLLLSIYALYIAITGVAIVNQGKRSDAGWAIVVLLIANLVFGLVLGSMLGIFGILRLF